AGLQEYLLLARAGNGPVIAAVLSAVFTLDEIVGDELLKFRKLRLGFRQLHHRPQHDLSRDHRQYCCDFITWNQFRTHAFSFFSCASSSRMRAVKASIRAS